MPTFGSLFAGIGGIDLGLERAGWECRWQVEWDAYCQRVLAKHWPDVPRYGDITTVDWSGVERVDLLAGGFPCQPVSVAGKRRGQDDERWLWPEFERAIRCLGPRYVLVENVPGLLVRGMGDVQRGLAALGYRRRWDVLAAADVGAPHLRQRVWIVASRTELPGPLAHAGSGRGPDNRLRAGWNESRAGGSPLADTERMGPAGFQDAARGDDANGHDTRRAKEAGWAGERSGYDAMADTIGERLEGTEREPGGDVGARSGRRRSALAHADSLRREGERVGGLSGDSDAPLWNNPNGRRGTVPDPDGGDAQGLVQERDGSTVWKVAGERPTRLLDGEGRYPIWAPEPDVGRVAHGVPNRVDRLRALGNAVVPQVVEVIGRQLLEAMTVTE